MGSTPLQDLLPYSNKSPAAINPLRQQIPYGCQCLRILLPYRNQSPTACIPIQLLLPYGSLQLCFPLPYGNQCPTASVLLFLDPLRNKSPINSISVYSNHIFYCPIRTIPYSSYSHTAFTTIQELIAISSTPLQKLILYSLRFSMGIITRFLCCLIAFNSLQELMLIYSTPLQELIPYSFHSPIPRSTSNSPTLQPTIQALLLQE